MKTLRLPCTYWTLNLKEAGVAETLTDREKLLQLASDGFKYANSLKIFLDEADLESVDTIEGNLIYSLEPAGNTRGKNKRPDRILEVVRENAVWATDAVREKIKRPVCFG